MRLTPCLFIIKSFSLVIVSGRPASTVYSPQFDLSTYLSIIVSNLSNATSSSEVGVPPPIYNVNGCNLLSVGANACRAPCTGELCEPAIFATLLPKSLSSVSKYLSTYFPNFSILNDVNEQYKHVLLQNGTPTYTL